MRAAGADHGSNDMYARAKRLAARIGLSTAEQDVAAAGGLRAAERAAAWLERRAGSGGGDVALRPVVLAAVLAVALAAVSEDAEFNAPPGR